LPRRIAKAMRAILLASADAHREDAHLSTILTQVGHAARQPVSFVTTMAALSRWAETREAPVPGRSR
jgi:hypothetical protein